MNSLDIAAVSKQSGLAASTLRYYEDRGLIQSIGRSGLRRVFSQDVLDRLALIALGQAAGFSLDEIADLFAGSDGRTVDRDAMRAKADALDQTIRRLTAMRDGLRHAAACSAPSHWECPKFQRLLNVAAKGRMAPPKPLKTRQSAG